MQMWTLVAATLVLAACSSCCHSQAAPMALPGCPSSCGGVAIPYPFGVGAGCHLPGFNLTCDAASHHPPKLFLGDGTIEVLRISLEDGTVRVRSAVADVRSSSDDDDDSDSVRRRQRQRWRQLEATWGHGIRRSSRYHLAAWQNRLVVFGCGVQAALLREGDNLTVAACVSVCPGSIGTSYALSYGCSGVGCCETPILVGSPSYRIIVKSLGSNKIDHSGVSLYIVDKRWLKRNHRNVSVLRNSDSGGGGGGGDRPALPAVVYWAMDASAGGCPADGASNTAACISSNSFCKSTSASSVYSCHCSPGYEGNPYLKNGCQDIDECMYPTTYLCYGKCINMQGSFRCVCPEGTKSDDPTKHECAPHNTRKFSAGLLVGLGLGSGMGLISIVIGIIFLMQKAKTRRAKKLREKFFKQNHGLLLQQLVDKDIAERMIFTLDELEMATNKFDEVRKVGGGGHGTVYKGILSNQHVVAIKKSKITIQKEIDGFINEVAILSQINHRNVVRLFGCCLETQVPLLIYEFVSNGTLSDHLHVECDQSLSWDDRLRIALEIASALAYLHSSASISIIHRDIKTSNILIDDRMVVKISDFGASRGIPIDQVAVTTTIQGTFGYLDPEYYQTSRLTDKSDVYSFGVILVELLTRKKPHASITSLDGSLIGQFNLAMTQNKLCEILDPQVISEGREDAKKVAKLASACLILRGEERPTMRQVEMKLERLLGSNRNIERGHPTELNCGPTHISNDNEIKSRQYSIEHEFLVSTSFPR